MNHRLPICLLSAALLCAVCPPLLAQATGPRISHVPIQGGFSPDIADKYLDQRFQEAKTIVDTQRVLDDLTKNPGRYGIQPGDAALLKDKLDQAGNDPRKVLQNRDVQDIIQRVKDKYQNQPNITDDQRERFQQFVKNLPSPLPPPGKPNSPNAKPLNPPNTPATDPAKPSAESNGKPPEQPAGADPNGNPVPGPNAPAPPSPPPNLPKKEMRDIAEWLADSRLADSPAFRRMVMNLDRIHMPEGPGVAAWDRRLERFGDRFANLGSHLPDLSWPKFNSSPRGPVRRPNPLPGPLEVPDRGNQLLFVLMAMGAVALFLWAVLRRRGWVLLRRAENRWQLGPWPVRPEAVRTRDELVRAFEYLALLRFGLAACSQNHREIADHLGQSELHHRAAAERLAGLYEQARYAPPEEALPDADLAAARADLSLLAGVAAA